MYRNFCDLGTKRKILIVIHVQVPSVCSIITYSQEEIWSYHRYVYFTFYIDLCTTHCIVTKYHKVSETQSSSAGSHKVTHWVCSTRMHLYIIILTYPSIPEVPTAWLMKTDHLSYHAQHEGRIQFAHVIPDITVASPTRLYPSHPSDVIPLKRLITVLTLLFWYWYSLQLENVWFLLFQSTPKTGSKLVNPPQIV